MKESGAHKWIRADEPCWTKNRVAASRALSYGDCRFEDAVCDAGLPEWYTVGELMATRSGRFLIGALIGSSPALRITGSRCSATWPPR